MSSKKPTIKRILKEASELASQPSPDYHAAPLESDLFEWHFTLRGPPAPSPFDGGIYHGRIVLPPAYPLKPPSFRFLTPTGRFEVNREICLSISGHHEETWQPAWGIRTALVAIRSFMDTEAKGQVGGMDASEGVRKRMALASQGWKCATCGKENGAIMNEVEESVKAAGGEGKAEAVPEELRLAYREDLGEAEAASSATSKEKTASSEATGDVVAQAPTPASTSGQAETRSLPIQMQPQALPPQQAQQPPQQRQPESPTAWIDKAIYGVLAAILFLLWKKFLL